MTSLGRVAEVETLVCDKVQLPNGSGSAGDVVESDGVGGVRWGSGAGPNHVNNPMTSDLNLGGNDIIGTGVFRGNGFNFGTGINADVPGVPSVDGAIYGMRIVDGSFGKKPYQQLLNSSGGFPTGETTLFNSGCPITGPTMLAEGAGTLSVGGASIAAKPADQTGGTDLCVYDPSNCRGTLAGSEYFAFWLQDTLPGVSGAYGVDPVKGNLLVECDYEADFGSSVGNEIVIKLEHSGGSNPGTGVVGPTISTFTLDDRRSDRAKIVGSASKMIIAIEPAFNVSVGDAFALFAEVPASSARGCDVKLMASFTWIPSP